MLPLAGVTVVSLEQAVAAPYATRQLADLGARVIKVERPGGDFARDYDRTVKGMSAYFVWCNRGKESVVLDLKEEGDRALLDRILEQADVFVQNLAPGAAERLGLGAEQLRERWPRLIVCGISGYGDRGPYRDKKAFDLLVQCEAGLVSLTGTPEAPARAGASLADVASAMYAYSGILTALYERERTGLGSSFEVSMLDALGEWLGQPLYTALYGDAPLARSGARHPSIAPYGHYRAGDGGEVFLSVQSDRDWIALCEQVLRQPGLVRDPRFADNPARHRHDAELTPILEDSFADCGTAELMERLEAAGIANARLRSMTEFADHPQHLARDRWREFDSPAGPLRGLLPPVTVHGRETPLRPVPALGQHTDAIRAEFGDGAGMPMVQHTETVTTWHLEQGSAEEARAVPAPGELDLRVVRAEQAGPEFARFLYTAVGGAWSWTDRLPWTYAQWEQYLAKPGVELWVAWMGGTPAGYVELEPHDGGVVEIAYFGLLPAFIGRRIGGHLLGEGLRRAWDLAERHPSLPGTQRVTVHTCSLDGPAALPNYEARGLRVCRTETADQPVAVAPGPWPGALSG